MPLLNGGYALPLAITNGPNGSLWFVAVLGDNYYISRLTTTGMSAVFPLTCPQPIANQEYIGCSPDASIAVGDGALWFTSVGQVVRFQLPAAHDFNYDGFSDIAWRNTNGDTAIWLMTPNGTQVQVLSTTDLGVVPTSWKIAGTGDFNADGFADILWRNTNGDTSIWLMYAPRTIQQVQVKSTTDFGV